jgi:hypothetical protein
METAAKTDLTVATEILNQLGGRRFVRMTGSKNFVATDNALLMQLSRNKSGAKYLKITLTAMDLYDIRFSKMNKNFDVVVVSEHKGVYDDRLRGIFEEVTGLYTSL